MKRLNLWLGLSLALAVAVAGCSNSDDPTGAGARNAVAGPYTAESPYTTDLVVGRKYLDVGEVNVWNDGSDLYVQYVTDGSWCLTETHLHVAESSGDVPQKNGNPIPGQFDHKGEHACVQDYTYQIPLGGWGPDDDLYIAAHAVVCQQGVPTGSGQSAWAEGVIYTVTLWAGQHMNAGNVTVAVVGDNLVVTYSTGGGWELLETHLYVGLTPPEKSAPGRFPYSNEDLGGALSDSYVIPLADLGAECGDVLYLATHAALWLPDGGEDGEGQGETGWGWGDDDRDELIDRNWSRYFWVRLDCGGASALICETAWGLGPDFPGRNWAMYLEYTVSDPGS